MKTETKTASTSTAASITPGAGRAGWPLLWTALLLGIILCIFFRDSFLPNKVVFANDDPLGIMAAEQTLMPATLKGLWQDLNWLGNESLSPGPNITTFLLLCTTPRAFLNIFYPLSLFIVGMGACFCLRKLKLSPVACILGGLAAALNGDFLSLACWGLASDVIAFGATFFAVGLLASATGPRRWVKIVLAGMAVGLNVMEAYDVGAIFSVFVAAYAVYHSLFLLEDGKPVSGRVGTAIARVALVAVAAFFIAFHTVSILVGTQIQGIAGVQQDEATKNARWDEATEWSVPKAEALQIFIPGLFGYRMDSPAGQNYWGAIGRDPNIGRAMDDLASPDEAIRNRGTGYLSNPSLLWRFSGTGIYAGVPVVVIALWAAVQGFRRRGSPFSPVQQRAIMFWTVIVVMTLLLSFGRYAPFYHFFYILPYASTIRNPLKFMHVFTWALIILFGYGVHGLVHAYMKDSVHRAVGVFAQFKTWLSRATAFDRRWMIISLVAVPVAVLCWLIYGSSNGELAANLPKIGIDPSIAPLTAKYSLQTVGWFAIYLAATVVLLALIFSGQFSGPRAKWGGLALGVLLFLDLGRADQTWVLYWDVDYKYASNAIIKILADKPWEHRVTKLPFASPISQESKQQIDLFQGVYNIEWHQQVFPYNDIQTLEMVQEPRVTVDKNQFLAAIPYPPMPNPTPASMLRTWELTSTRYLLGQGGAGFVDALDQQLDQHRGRFHIVQSFRLEPKPGTKGDSLTDYTAVPATNGELALIEFTGALPRAKLFSNWQVNTNADATLALLANPAFDVQQTVLVSEPGFPSPPPANAGQNPGTVQIDPNYKSKHFELSADVKVPSVLLMSERYNPKWQVEVDGKPAKLLRCDFIMRGIYLEPGKHHIVCQYVSKLTTLYVSIAADLVALLLCGYLAFTKDDPEPGSSEASESPPSTKSDGIK